VLPGDDLNRQSAFFRLAAKTRYTHATIGKCKLDRSGETQRCIKPDMMKITSDLV
jgi:hypothetical protein